MRPSAIQRGHQSELCRVGRFMTIDNPSGLRTDSRDHGHLIICLNGTIPKKKKQERKLPAPNPWPWAPAGTRILASPCQPRSARNGSPPNHPPSRIGRPGAPCSPSMISCISSSQCSKSCDGTRVLFMASARRLAGQMGRKLHSKECPLSKQEGEKGWGPFGDSTLVQIMVQTPHYFDKLLFNSFSMTPGVCPTLPAEPLSMSVTVAYICVVPLVSCIRKGSSMCKGP